MNRFEELINSTSAMPSVIVHLGAGSCREHDAYTAISPGRIIYVEADQYLVAAAKDTFSNTAHVKIISRAIAAENGQRTLNITNNRRFSSLLLPSRLLDFYPNIEVNDQAEVETVTLTKLCQDEEIAKASDNLLVAELQGMEKEVFASAEIDTLQSFKWIIIRTSITNLYASASEKTQRSLPELMKDAGFIVLAFEEDAPPFINILCIRDDEAIDNKRGKIHEAKLLDTIRIHELKLSEQKVKLSDLKTSNETAVTELQLSLSALSDDLNQAETLIQSFSTQKEEQLLQIKELTSAVANKSGELNQAQVQIQSFTTKIEDQVQQIKELSNAVDTRTAELGHTREKIETFSKEKGELLKQVKVLTIAKEGLLKQVKKLADAVDTTSIELIQNREQIQLISTEKETLIQQIGEFSDSIKVREKELTEMQQTLRINNKLILKSDNDLRDLQLQYRTALQHQEQQHTLLCELKAKLRQASEFYQKLNLQNIVLDADLLEQSDSNSKD